MFQIGSVVMCNTYKGWVRVKVERVVVNEGQTIYFVRYLEPLNRYPFAEWRLEEALRSVPENFA